MLEEQKNPDEIVVRDIDMVHFEMMDDGFLWCGIYHKNGQVDHFNITSKKNKLSTLWMPDCGCPPVKLAQGHIRRDLDTL